jgi:hypothetical protein
MTKSLICLFSLIVLAGCSTPTSRNMPELTKMEPRISVITLGVADLQRSYEFYKNGLGFPTKMTPDGGIILFTTSSGSALMLYSYDKLAVDATFKTQQNENKREGFPGFTLGHCVRSRQEVDAVLAQAQKAGGKIVKPAATTSWGGYSGYFQDPDGYSWEVLYSDNLKFRADGSVIVEQ